VGPGTGEEEPPVAAADTLNKREMVLSPEFATARSSRPLPSKSAAVIPTGVSPAT